MLNCKAIRLFLYLFGSIALANCHRCDSSFGKYLECMSERVADKLNVLKSELEPQRQVKIAKCFANSNCSPPNFTKAVVDHFVTDTVWRQRLHRLLEFLDDVHPKVSKCMVDYFVSGALDTLGRCVKLNGPISLLDFRFPPLKIDIHFQMDQVKQVILNRMLVRSELKECARNNQTAVTSLLGCLNTAKAFKGGDQVCKTRTTCKTETIVDSQCASRLDDVLKATCSCLDNKIGQLKTMPINTLASTFNQGLISGQVEVQFKKCHTSLGLAYPEEKLENVKRVFKDTVVDIIMQKQVPDAIKNAMRLLLDSFKDFGREWSGILCSNCASGQDEQLHLDMEVKHLKTIAQESLG